MTDVQPSMVDIQSKHIVMESESMTALVILVKGFLLTSQKRIII